MLFLAMVALSQALRELGENLKKANETVVLNWVLQRILQRRHQSVDIASTWGARRFKTWMQL
jgi:hypothetical protein